MKETRILVIITAAVVMFGSIFAFAGIMVKRADMRRQARCTYEVTATVVENEYEVSRDSDGDTTRTYHPVFEYTYNDEKFVIKSSNGSNPPVFEVGEKVTAYVNTFKPQEIYVPADNTVRSVYTVFIIIGIGIAALGILVPTAIMILIIKSRRRSGSVSAPVPVQTLPRSGSDYSPAPEDNYSGYDEYNGPDRYDDYPDYDEYDDLKGSKRRK